MEEIREKTSKNWQTLDIYLSSFLQLNGFPPRLELNNNRVVFVFDISDEIYKLIADYNSNIPIAVTDYVTTVKRLRGQMLTMRGPQR